MVEACVYDDGETCCEEDSVREDEKREGSVAISIISRSWSEPSYLRKKWGNKWRLGRRR